MFIVKLRKINKRLICFHYYFLFLSMKFFDFHHHTPAKTTGIYNLKLSESIPGFPFSAGIHPISGHDDYEENFSWLKETATLDNCVAIGECGLDGRIDVDEKIQEEIFHRQISLANDLKKPLIIHCVKRYSELIRIKNFADVPMVIHGFNKKKSIAGELLKHQFYFSFGKSLLYNIPLQEFLKSLPDDRFFLETDDADFEISELYQLAASIKNSEIEQIEFQIINNLKNISINL